MEESMLTFNLWYYLKQNGIIHQTTDPYTPQQNGLAETTNRRLVEMARSMLHLAQLPLNFWG